MDVRTGTLYPELNTIAEGSSADASRLDASLAPHNLTIPATAAPGSDLVLEAEAGGKSTAEGQGQSWAAGGRASPALSPLSRAVRDKVAKARERSLDLSLVFARTCGRVRACVRLALGLG
jgi:hypothetical protein